LYDGIVGDGIVGDRLAENLKNNAIAVVEE
jgi:hypothetical protein